MGDKIKKHLFRVRIFSKRLLYAKSVYHRTTKHRHFRILFSGVDNERLLSKQKSVTEAAELSGFPDVSAMISLFKKQYGVTSHKYKKSHAR
ncbi:MAG: hypothetical protein IKB38_04145 [Clostridia bacterium]|nr:hypothetical protein [Clostridia bacterium]